MTTVITGVGSGLGASLVRKFGREGHDVAMFARSTDFSEGLAEELAKEGIESLPVAVDITDAEQVKAGFDLVRAELGPIDVLINHAGNAAWGEFGQLSAEDFERSWQVCAQGSFLCCKEAVPDMVKAGSGSILFTGATSSIRGRAGAIAFSSAKFAVRGLADALARELWPRGIHVAHVIIDAVLDTPSLRESGSVEGPVMDVDATADAYWALTQQDRKAWTFEIELRPHDEEFFV